MFSPSMHRCSLIALFLTLLCGVSEAQEAPLSLLVTSSETGLLLVVDAESGQVDATIRVGDGPTGLAVSENGDRAVIANSGKTAAGSTLSLVNTTTRQVIRTIHLEGSVGLTPEKQTFFKPTAVAFLPGGEQLVAASSASGCLVFVGAKTGRILGAAPFKGRGASHVIVSPDGAFVFVSHPDSGSISVVDVARRQTIKEIPLEAGGTGDMALTPDGKQMWVVNSSTNSISVIDVEKQAEILEFASGSYPRDIAFTRDGKMALCTNFQSGSISVYNTGNYKAMSEISLAEAGAVPHSSEATWEGPPPVSPCGLMFTDPGTDRERAFVALQGSDRICELDLDSMGVKRTIQLPVKPFELGWSRTTLAFAPAPK
ncbi:MAG: beta-propeller fold lactonase family protein [Planctomycetota bacterium]|nr:beta-propeller fold lactonase family protein [Planctomycetota bacterium]